MLPVDWPLTPVLLWGALVGLIAVLVIRAIRRDRREYQRFKRYRTTRRRQAMLLTWLRDSAITIGGLSIVLLVLSWQFVGPLLIELRTWIAVPELLGWVIVVAVVLVIAALTIVGFRAVRSTPEEAVMLGDIAAMIPRNRQEIRIGWLLSLNAGVSEELMFRLAVPAALYGASGSAIVAVAGSVVLFGALHIYQGAQGVVGSTIVGAALMAAYIATGSIVAPVVLHVLLDLRSLVVLPSMLYGAHRIDGTVQRVIAPLPKPKPEPKPEESPSDGSAP
ncbi:membrane protease YdiL (CAAX protease family) [Microbacteriaceae bacterium SG_E_30_P1]|uniref:Membrane protease YdiL (CAAX protease family) n=1 Tax=Antiquaquibacter oligotrophicus TaxID=2880260 RepID=A0ABT6KJX2_9MICO|nr:CPBP family intramembrane glutamic endopeptidase [Antiquaquibacter oligotrophicus]MDH6180299.1 membrane protease YdiL (CAAX protease family) [Antiquaquibacter oligotrophicus]UDF13954.1 CPBP family intramembrane metalloprotease [Antiquaquibacter oligotrophicus]